MIIDSLVRMVTSLPRGGARIISLLSRIAPRLKAYPLTLPFPSGVVLLADLSNNVFYPLLKYGVYPHQVTEDLIITCLLKNDDVVIDVGANIGYVSAICAGCIGAGGKVHSFEPSRVTIGYIRQLSKQLTQIQPWPLAVSNVCGSVQFIDEDMSDRSHIGGGDDRGYQVTSVSLDSWAATIHLTSLSFIKIDAEGFDLEVVLGSLSLISKYKPIIEYEAFSSEAVMDIALQLNSFSNNNDYVIYRVFNRYPLTAISNTSATNNYFAIPKMKASMVPEFLYDRGFLVPVSIDP